jgi:hypothetical protein
MKTEYFKMIVSVPLKGQLGPLCYVFFARCASNERTGLAMTCLSDCMSE